MSDLISRQDAINDVKTIYEWHDTVTEDRIITHLKMLPSAEPEPKWIPVTEALPEENKNVLVTTIDGERRVSHLTDITYWWNIGRGKVIAWMPLPEPWRGE